MMSNDEVVQKIREIARSMGWAIGVHGSMKRDIDLIATPWVQDAAGTWDLFEKIRDAIGADHSSAQGNLRMPHGRQALMIIQKGAVSYKGRNGMDDWIPPAIDISFVDSRNKPKEENKTTKAEAVMDAIRQTDVGSDIIIQNEDMSIAYILTMKCIEHPEKLDEEGGMVIK